MQVNKVWWRGRGAVVFIFMYAVPGGSVEVLVSFPVQFIYAIKEVLSFESVVEIPYCEF